MKSLSITVLISIVLLAAGLIVIYKTPAPEAEGARLVLRIDNSQRPDAVSSDSSEPQMQQPDQDAQPQAQSDQGSQQAQPDGQSTPVNSNTPPALGSENPTRTAESQPDQAPAPRSGFMQDPAGPGADGGLAGHISPWDAFPGRVGRQGSPLEPHTAGDGGESLQPAEAPAQRSAANEPPAANPDQGNAGWSTGQDQTSQHPANSDAGGQTAALTAPDNARPAAQMQSEAPADMSMAPPESAGASNTPDNNVVAASPPVTLPPPSPPQSSPAGWKASTASEPAAPSDATPPPAVNIPIPPLPKRRVDQLPLIARDRSSYNTHYTLPEPPPTVRTADTEQRNAIEVAAIPPPPIPTAAPAAVSPRVKPGAARIAIIVRDAGRDERDTYAAINSLKPEITLAFSPYARDVRSWARKAKESGHEVFLGVPMEPATGKGEADSPNMLLASLSPEENLKRLDWVLSQIDGYSGLINIMGGKLSQKPEALRPFMEAVKSRGLTYVDDGAAAHPFAILAAAQLQLPYRVADSRIDDDPSSIAIHNQLQQLVDIAREKGSALGVASADAETVRQLILWEAGLPSQNVALVRASEIVVPIKLP